MARTRNTVVPKHDDPEAMLAAKVAQQDAAVPVELEEIEDAGMVQDQADLLDGPSNDLMMAPRTEHGSTGLLPYQDLSESFDQRDVAMPGVRVAQFMSKVVTNQIIPAGHWYLSAGNVDLGEAINIIPLKAFKHRTRFGRGTQQGQLLCRSSDMVRGLGDPGILCQTCSFKDWPQGAPPPECGENMNFPVIVLPDELTSPIEDLSELEMGVITFRSTSMKAAQTLLGNAFQRGAKVRPDAWSEHFYKLSLGRQQNNRGTFFVPIVGYGGKVTVDRFGREMVEYARDMVRSLQSSASTASLANTVMNQQEP